MTFEEVEHTADWAIRVRGGSLAELIANAAEGLMQLAGVVCEPAGGAERPVSIESFDRESLLVDFLSELVVALELRGIAYRDLRIETTHDRKLFGTLRELPVRTIAKPVKAVTYNELEIEQQSGEWAATIVFDV